MRHRSSIAGAAAVLWFTAAPGAQLGDPTHDTTTTDVPGLTVATSQCRTSSDQTYGTTVANPVKTGGGALYAASREVKYLNALRGPAGEGVHFRRTGSLNAPDRTILDAYTVEVTGGQRSTIYMDAYHWSDPTAPVGFLCSIAIGLAPPGPDAFETTDQRMTIAVGLGAGDVAPISLDADGSKRHGVVYDHPRLIGLAAKAAASAGATLNPKALPREVSQPRLAIIATPLMCAGETIAPESVILADSRGGQPATSAKAAGEKIAELAPGLPATPGAIAVVYSVPALITGARLTVHYGRPCDGNQDVVLPVTMTAARVVSDAPAPALPGKPAPASGARVVLQLFVAADGTALYPVFSSGDYEFRDAALESVKNWRFEPARVNGAPLIQPEQVMIVVR